MEEAKKGRFSAGPLAFAVRNEIWDGNIQGNRWLPLEPTPNLGAVE